MILRKKLMIVLEYDFLTGHWIDGIFKTISGFLTAKKRSQKHQDQMDAPQLHKQISSHSLVPWMPLKGLGILERARGVRSILQRVLG